jgi:hypothetical protein
MAKNFLGLVAVFEAWNISISEFITFLLSTPSLQNSSLVQDLCVNGAVISLTIDTAFPSSSAPVSDALFQRICDHLKDETQRLVIQSEKQGWQFGAIHAQAEQFKQFRIDEMAKQLATISPRLWLFIGSLISPTYKPDELLEVNVSDLEGIGEATHRDLDDMIQELTDDKPTREERKVARDKEILKLVLVFLIWY